MDEFKLIQKIRNIIPPSLKESYGLCDDAAVLNRIKPNQKLLWTTDVIVEDVDFIRKKAPAEAVGHKSLAINLSDIAAMGAKPLACLVTLGIPKNLSEKWILKFYRGLIQLASKHQVQCAGGDITKASKFFASVTVLGTSSDYIVSRKGAKPGDYIAVTGCLGGSILGHHLSFMPRVNEGLFLAERIQPHAMIDISDGFLQDLKHLLKTSGVGAEIDTASLPISKAALQKAGGNKHKALQYALTDGEDFELLMAVSATQRKRMETLWSRSFPDVRLHWIGKICLDKGIKWSHQGRRTRSPINKYEGYRHFYEKN